MQTISQEVVLAYKRCPACSDNNVFYSKADEVVGVVRTLQPWLVGPRKSSSSGAGALA